MLIYDAYVDHFLRNNNEITVCNMLQYSFDYNFFIINYIKKVKYVTYITFLSSFNCINNFILATK